MIPKIFSSDMNSKSETNRRKVTIQKDSNDKSISRETRKLRVEYWKYSIILVCSTIALTEAQSKSSTSEASFCEKENISDKDFQIKIKNSTSLRNPHA